MFWHFSCTSSFVALVCFVHYFCIVSHIGAFFTVCMFAHVFALVFTRFAFLHFTCFSNHVFFCNLFALLLRTHEGRTDCHGKMTSDVKSCMVQSVGGRGF